MKKQPKKRTKKYTGVDARTNRSTPTNVHRYTAVRRTALGQWWFEHKRAVRIISITTLIMVVVVWLIHEAIRAIAS